MMIPSQQRRIFQLAAIPSIIFFLGALLLWPVVAIGQSDVKLYYRYTNLILQGGVPYHTFSLEYPPLALVPMLLPRLVSFGFPLSITVYWFLLLCENTLWFYLLTLLGCRFAALLGRKPRGVLVSMGVLAPIIASNLPWRFDLFPALLTALALLAVCSAQPMRGGAWLGAGVATKLYPAVIAPPLFVRSLIWRRWGEAACFAFGLVALGGLACVPFLFVDPAGFLQMFRYHGMRGIQVDSVAAGGIFVGKLLGLTTLDVKLTYGSFNMVTPWADVVLPWLMPIFIVTYGVMMVFVVWTELRLYKCNEHGVQEGANGRDISMICRYALISILLFIITNKVYSLQYVAWIIPFVFLFSRSENMLFLCIVSISMFLYPVYYGRLTDGELSAVILLNIKNVATILLFVSSIRKIWRYRPVKNHLFSENVP